MTLHFLLYTSRLCKLMSRNELADLLKVSQTKNLESGITGFLHIEHEIVLQYLEGALDPLCATVERIRADHRHRNFEVLFEGEIDQRFFDDWDMGLVESSTLSLCDLLGVKPGDVEEIRKANPVDLITLLSANSSFLRLQPA